MRYLFKRRARQANGSIKPRRPQQEKCLCSFFRLKKTKNRTQGYTQDSQTATREIVLTKNVREDDSTDEEVYYTAQSVFCNGMVGDGQPTEVLHLKQLDAAVPAPIPSAAISAASLVPPFCTRVPGNLGAKGDWKKDLAASTPSPNEVEAILNSSIFVQTVRKRITDFAIDETDENFSFIVKIPVPYYKPRVETFKKDGTVVRLGNRRDDRSGTAFGQAIGLVDGRVMTRVWNLGSSPEVMWQEIFDFSKPYQLKVEHSIFTMDGYRKAKKITIANKPNS